jgi:hypothetical protein
MGVTVLAAGAGVVQAKTVGKNPGKIKGRWLEVADPSVLAGVQGVYLGDMTVDIQWKNERNEAPIEEDLLEENLVEQLTARLEESRVFGPVLESAPEEGAPGYLRLDCTVEVEPGSRAMRYAVGFGAGKSRSILEIHLVDHATGEEVGLYHGYGVGSGMGFKLAGGGARKMTQDDIQENTKLFVELVAEIQ